MRCCVTNQIPFFSRDQLAKGQVALLAAPDPSPPSPYSTPQSWPSVPLNPLSAAESYCAPSSSLHDPCPHTPGRHTLSCLCLCRDPPPDHLPVPRNCEQRFCSGTLRGLDSDSCFCSSCRRIASCGAVCPTIHTIHQYTYLYVRTYKDIYSYIYL